MSKHLEYFIRPPKGAAVTKTVEVHNAHTGACVGEIRWHGAWRQYAFFPYHDTLFNTECLFDICAKVGALTEEHRRLRGTATRDPKGVLSA